MAAIVLGEELVSTGSGTRLRRPARLWLEEAGVARSLGKVASFLLRFVRRIGCEIVEGMRDATEMERRLDAIRRETELKSWNLPYFRPF